MAMSDRRAVVAVFDDRQGAEMAVQDLYSAGFTEDQVGIALRDTGGSGAIGQAAGEGAGGGATAGAVGGATVGGILGALAAGLIPGIGPVIAGGILAGVLGGAALGAVGGGIVGALVGEGVPEEEARYYDREFRSGRTVVTVRSGDRLDVARSILRSHSGRFAEGERSETDTADTRAGREQDVSGRRDVEPGEGSIGTSTGRERDTEFMTDAGSDRGSAAMRRGGYGRSGDELGRMEAGYRPWGEVREDYHAHWSNRHGAAEQEWQAGEPSYHYGYEMAHDPRYRNRTWEEAEPELRRTYSDWYRQSGYGGEASTWEQIKDDIRSAWDDARRGKQR